MEIIEFDSTVHRGMLVGWLAKRDHPPVLDFPINGYCVLHDDTIVCCGFLRLIEGGYALLDGYATDPDAPAELRNKSLNLLTKYLVTRAKQIGIRGLFATSIDNNTIKRALEHKFSVLPYAVLVLDIRKAE